MELNKMLAYSQVKYGREPCLDRHTIDGSMIDYSQYLDSIKDHVAMSKFLAGNRDRGHGDLHEKDYDAIRQI